MTDEQVALRAVREVAAEGCRTTRAALTEAAAARDRHHALHKIGTSC
jgi:hypothetical protein